MNERVCTDVVMFNWAAIHEAAEYPLCDYVGKVWHHKDD